MGQSAEVSTGQTEDRYYYLHGSWQGDSIEIRRADNRDAKPIGHAYLTPQGLWWI
ncbi:hypothetical protein [Natronoglycomyces albus]|uniref:Uncharacterized protein n=1 Tax=Natronoglycomyces albus TaxID=2811108 RepID=A0A895XIV9_9ACTN|nr:hypothetical protein [Natronoglycomyces albus]QSB05274.1 hypothetical protein JQS30_16225 [Natronoglycomyces albus]